jgi:arylsulfatase A
MALYDLKADIGEKTDIADQHPDVVKRLLALADKARLDLGDTNYRGKQRPAGWVEIAKPLTKD